MKKLLILGALIGGMGALGAKMEVVNKSPTAIGVDVTLTDGVVRGQVIASQDKFPTDAFLAGFTKIRWTYCGKIYEAKLDIIGVTIGLNELKIEKEKLYKKDLFGNYVEIQNVSASGESCKKDY